VVSGVDDLAAIALEHQLLQRHGPPSCTGRPGSPAGQTGLGEYYSEGETREPTWLVAGDAAGTVELVGLDGRAANGGTADPEVVQRWLDDGIAPNGQAGIEIVGRAQSRRARRCAPSTPGPRRTSAGAHRTPRSRARAAPHAVGAHGRTDEPAFTRADLVELVGALLSVDAPGDPRDLIEQLVDTLGVRISATRPAHHREGHELLTVERSLPKKCASSNWSTASAKATARVGVGARLAMLALFLLNGCPIREGGGEGRGA
jgi:hypothetical protein